MSIITAIVCLMGGAIFVFDMILEGESSWWFGTPFFACDLSDGLTSFLLYLAYREF